MSNGKDKNRARKTRSRFSVSSILQRLGLTRVGGRNVIGMQLAGSLLRIIEIDKGVSPPRVINFSAIDPLMDNPTEATDQILGLMHEKNISPSVVHGMVCDSGVEHRQISLPVLGRNEMQAVVRREVKKIIPESSGRDIAFDFWYDRSGRRSGRKADVLVGVVPREAPARIIGLMENCGLETQLVSTVPLTLIAALGILGEKATAKIATMVHLERDRSFLVISNRGNWVFSREFQPVLSKEESQAEQGLPLQARRQFASARYLADPERLLIEVNRSLLYFKQRFRGEGVSLIVLSGEAFNLDEVSAEMGKNIGIETMTFTPGDAFRYDHLGDRADKLKRIFPSLALPLGAALQSDKDAKLNFVPPAYRSRRTARLKRTLSVAAAVVLFIGMSSGYLMLRSTRLELEETIRHSNLQERLAELSKRMDEIAEVKQKRDQAETRRSFIARFDVERSPERLLLLALSNYVPEKAFLMNVSVNEQGDVPTASITGQVQSRSISEADSTLNVLYRRMQESGLFTGLKEPRLSGRYEGDSYLLSFSIETSLHGGGVR